MYYPFVRRVLFQLDPERVHELTLQQLCCIIGTSLEVLARRKVPAKSVICTGSASKNPLGLAAGLDRDREHIDAFGAMGFGSVETSTVTPRLQPGNNKPRLFRLIDIKGLINRMGLNNHGVDNLVENVKKSHFGGILGISIGKNKDTLVENGKDDYLTCMKKVHAYTGYTAINISSPNTPGLRTLQYGEALDDLLTAIKNKQNDLQAVHRKYVPVMVEVALDLSAEELIQVADSLVRHSVDDVAATNTALNRFFVQGIKGYDQIGDPNGRSLQLESTEIIRQLSQESKGQLPIINVGGIDSVIAAHEKIAVGATFVQICSGFIFRGPPLIKEIVSNI